MVEVRRAGDRVMTIVVVHEEDDQRLICVMLHKVEDLKKTVIL